MEFLSAALTVNAKPPPHLYGTGGFYINYPATILLGLGESPYYYEISPLD